MTIDITEASFLTLMVSSWDCPYNCRQDTMWRQEESKREREREGGWGYGSNWKDKRRVKIRTSLRQPFCLFVFSESEQIKADWMHAFPSKSVLI